MQTRCRLPGCMWRGTSRTPPNRGTPCEEGSVPSTRRSVHWEVMRRLLEPLWSKQRAEGMVPAAVTTAAAAAGAPVVKTSSWHLCPVLPQWSSAEACSPKNIQSVLYVVPGSHVEAPCNQRLLATCICPGEKTHVCHGSDTSSILTHPCLPYGKYV